MNIAQKEINKMKINVKTKDFLLALKKTYFEKYSNLPILNYYHFKFNSINKQLIIESTNLKNRLVDSIYANGEQSFSICVPMINKWVEELEINGYFRQIRYKSNKLLDLIKLLDKSGEDILEIEINLKNLLITVIYSFGKSEFKCLSSEEFPVEFRK